MKHITYRRALEVDQLKRGFFLWWNQKYVTVANPSAAPTLTTVLNDLAAEQKDWGIAIYISMKLSGKLMVMYPKKPEIHKLIKFKDGKQVAYTVYAPKDRHGKQAVIAQKKEREDVKTNEQEGKLL